MSKQPPKKTSPVFRLYKRMDQSSEKVLFSGKVREAQATPAGYGVPEAIVVNR